MQHLSHIFKCLEGTEIEIKIFSVSTDQNRINEKPRFA